ncbi:hypothetical protein [Yoonia sp. R2-816]|uniref:hypothetical protein n=1 Tax=Yoonia sp. R2-816 TaxID=3342638 RepID=UPI0037291B89
MFLPTLVSALRKEGWDVIPVQSAYTDTISQIVSDTNFNGQGRIAAIAHVDGIKPAELVAPMEEETLLRQIFSTNGLLPDDSPRNSPRVGRCDANVLSLGT